MLGLLLGCLAGSASALEPDKLFYQYVQDTWTDESGLPEVSVAAITQATDGYLWVGTQRGLARFDGVTFRVFGPDNTPALKSSYISSLLADSRGRIFVGSYTGAAVYEQGHFADLRFVAGGKVLDQLRVWQIRALPSGAIVAATDAGLFRLADDRTFMAWPVLGDRPVYSLAVGDKVLWAGSLGGVYRIDAKGNAFVPLVGSPHPVNANTLAVAQGTLWVGGDSGLFYLNGAGLIPFPVPAAYRQATVSALYADSDNNLWASSAAGLLRIRDRRVQESVDRDDPAGTAKDLSIYEDRERNLWIGSGSSGLMRVWNGWIYRYSKRSGLKEPETWNIVPRRAGGFWVATSAGFHIFENGSFRQVVTRSPLPTEDVLCFFEDTDRLWIGTNEGVAQYRAGEILIPSVLRPLAGHTISAIYKDRQGAIWIGSGIGVFRYADGVLRKVPAADGKAVGFATTFSTGPDARLYVATSSGLYAVQGDSLQRVDTEGALHADLTQGLVLTREGPFVAATDSGALAVRVGTRWYRFSEADGLPENTSTYAGEDHNGMLWLAGSLGLYRLPVADFQAYINHAIPKLRAEMVLSNSGKLPGTQKTLCCNAGLGSSGVMLNNILWLPTTDGIIAVPVDRIAKNSVVPQVHIERIRYRGDWHDVQDGARMALPAGARDLAFEFTALSFRDPKSVRIRYRLVGYDQDWQELGDPLHRAASYTNLPAGSYSFQVLAANDSGVANRTPATLQFQIAPYFYETAWFYAAVIALFLLSTYGFVRYRLYALNRERTRLESLVRARTEELAQANRSLQEASQSDQLTGLRNRRYLLDKLPADIANLHRALAQPSGARKLMGFLMVDLDHFNRINDRYGHAGGDEIMRSVGMLLRNSVRAEDYVIRWGGEEFLIVLRDLVSGSLSDVAAKISDTIRQHRFALPGGVEVNSTCSVGGIEYPLFMNLPAAISWQRHIELADLTMYQVKHAGRDGWAIYRPRPGAAAASRADLAAASPEELIASGALSLETSRREG